MARTNADSYCNNNAGVYAGSRDLGLPRHRVRKDVISERTIGNWWRRGSAPFKVGRQLG